MTTRFGSTASDTLQALHRAADLELADEGGIAPLEDERNLAQRHRFSGQRREKYPLWPVVLVLAVFWIVVILAVRGCA